MTLPLDSHFYSAHKKGDAIHSINKKCKHMSAKLLIWSSCAIVVYYVFFSSLVCVCVFCSFTLSVCYECFFLHPSRISLTHCVVSRSTSVIIITSALYFIWHAVSSSPLDTFLFVCRASLALIHAHFISNWNGVCVCLRYHLSVVEKFFTWTEQHNREKNMSNTFSAQITPAIWNMFHFAERIFNYCQNVIWFRRGKFFVPVSSHRYELVEHWK